MLAGPAAVPDKGIFRSYRNVLAPMTPDWNGSCMRCSHGGQVEFFGTLAHSFFLVKRRKL